MGDSDAKCIARCLNGHRDAFRNLVERYERPVKAFARGKVRDTATAEEITQEAFVRAYESLKNLRKHDAFFAWIIGIAGRVIQEHQRAASRQHEAFMRLANEPQQQPAESRDEELEAAIAELGEPYREVVLLRYYGELSCAEVAAVLDMPLGSVTKVLSRAYAMLRTRILDALNEPAKKEYRRCNHAL